MISNVQENSNYIISNATFCLTSYQHRDKVYSLILDKFGETTSPAKPLNLIRNTCRLHGSSYDASIYQAKQFFGDSKHKLPVMVAYDFGDPCILFPLYSPYSTQNIWIALNPIINIRQHSDQTILTFIDETELCLNVHMKSFNQQYVRAAMFYKHLLIRRRAAL